MGQEEDPGGVSWCNEVEGVDPDLKVCKSGALIWGMHGNLQGDIILPSSAFIVNQAGAAGVGHAKGMVFIA